jgi:hypothetical protein
MTTRDVTVIAFKTLAAWLLANGIAGTCSGLLTWSHSVALYGKDATIRNLAAAAICVPVGAIVWLVSDWAAQHVFSGRLEAVALTATRGDLYAFASVLVGLFLLADALPQAAYWFLVWRMSRDTVGWYWTSPDATEKGVVYWMAARAQMGSAVTKGVLGVILICGPDRVKRGLLRIRPECSSQAAEPQSDDPTQSSSERGGA